jgi:hypothetical protein
MKMEQSVPKRRHIKSRCLGITQKKEDNIPIRQKLEIKSRILCEPTRNLNQHAHSARHRYQELFYPEYCKKNCLTLQQSTQTFYVTYTFIFQLLHVFALPDMFREARIKAFEALLNGNGNLPRTDTRHQAQA